MFQDDYKAASNTALAKYNFLQKNPAGYVMSSFMAGLYIAIGSMMMGIIGSMFAGTPAQRVVNGLVFSVGLCLVTVAGAELFTGNNFIMAVGAMKKTVSWMQAVKVWVVCYLGNFAGSIVAAVVFTLTGLPSGDIGANFANTAAAKMAGTPLNLFARAILCNVLVCLAIWCGTKLKSEGAKIAMNYACVTTFVACGFEHSIANMTFLTIGLLNPMDAAVSIGGLFYNLVIVTIGNMIGGIVFVALPYYLISKEK